MRAARIFLGFFLIALLGVVCVSLMIETVPVAAYGVRQRSIGGSGVAEQDFNTGFHLGIAGVHKWYFIDKRTHFLTFSQTGVRESGKNQGPLSVRTKDNNTAAIDVTVTYRIIEGEANLLVGEGLQTSYQERVVSTVQSVLREELAQLSPEDFVNTEIRLQRAKDTLPVLQEALRQFHITPDRLLIRAVRFPDTYERKLQDRQLKQQLALLEKSLQNVEEALAKTGKIEKVTEADVKELIATWDKQIQEAESDNQVKVAKVLGESA